MARNGVFSGKGMDEGSDTKIKSADRELEKHQSSGLRRLPQVNGLDSGIERFFEYQLNLTIISSNERSNLLIKYQIFKYYLH